jgi:N-acetyl-gamma-glutamyl-phosphate reductase
MSHLNGADAPIGGNAYESALELGPAPFVALDPLRQSWRLNSESDRIMSLAAKSSSSKFRVAVVGGTGYGGAELLRLLLAHPNVEVVRVTSIDSVGEALEKIHVNLAPTGLVFENLPLAEAAQGVDLIFLALPHKVTAKLTPELATLSAKVVDLSGDFRLRDAHAYAEYYGGAHPHPEQLGRWIYGLPELNRDKIATATRVASPGCFATTIALGLLPLARHGLIRGRVQTVGCTGSSGSGAYASPGTHHPLRANNLTAYKILGHQHTPEIEQTLRDAGADKNWRLEFVPVSAPLTRGILANTFVRVPASWDKAKIDAIFRETYGELGFVRVLAGRNASVVAIKGSMWVDASFELGPIEGDERTLVVSTAADNLVKGGAGQAVQSMNIMFGLPERTGIDAPALWP